MYYLPKIPNTVLVVLFAVYSVSCANRVPPSGGPKDKKPPKLIGSIPKNGNTEVKTQEITLLFDEPIVQKNMRKELLITPRLKADYETKIKKNTVILQLKEPLDSATTYTFNFRESIVDITEGNPAQNLVLAFSTGKILDTLQIKGHVQELLTHKAANKITVGLYDALIDTLDLFNSPPYYLTETNKKGDYIFRNIKPGMYKVYAFKDGNNNNTCQSDREPYAFLNTAITLDSNVVADTLNLQHLNIDTLKIKRAKTKGHYFVATTSKYLTNISTKASNDSTLWFNLDKTHKEIKFYNTFPIKDSLLVTLQLSDSLNQTVKDTVYLKFEESTRSYDEFDPKITALEVYPESKKIKVALATSKPAQFYNTDSIRISLDSINYILFDSTWNIQTANHKTSFTLTNTLPVAYLDSLGTKNKTTGTKTKVAVENPNIGKQALPKKVLTKKKKKSEYKFMIPKGSIISIENDTSKQIATTIKPLYKKDFGLVKGKITTNYTHYIIQLVTPDFKVVKEISAAKKYTLKNITPGEYMIRILIDTNQNGRWDPGNILLNELPEPVLIYKDANGESKTSIRAKWEIKLDLFF